MGKHLGVGLTEKRDLKIIMPDQVLSNVNTCGVQENYLQLLLQGYTVAAAN